MEDQFNDLISRVSKEGFILLKCDPMHAVDVLAQTREADDFVAETALDITGVHWITTEHSWTT